MSRTRNINQKCNFKQRKITESLTKIKETREGKEQRENLSFKCTRNVKELLTGKDYENLNYEPVRGTKEYKKHGKKEMETEMNILQKM